MKRTLFTENWKFYKGEEDLAVRLDLPHDAMQGEARVKEAPTGGSGAFYESGCYVYEKTLPAGRHSKP